jgi:hypothetical protein
VTLIISQTGFQKDRRFRERIDPKWKYGSPLRVSLADRLEGGNAYVSTMGTSMKIPDFGTVHVCELLATSTTWKLEMLNIVLGSPVEGEITAGSVDVNGTWYP